VVTRDGQTRFFLWVADATDPKKLVAEGLAPQGTVQGVAVFGVRRRVWQAQGLDIWVEPAGPHGAVPPSPDVEVIALDVLGPLIAAISATPRPYPTMSLEGGP
jgi:hypothetical protein